MTSKVFLGAVVTLYATTCTFAFSQEKPPLPYFDWGACPFECCTYREWSTVKSVPIHKSRSKKSPVAFVLPKMARVQGVTGVVVTVNYGVTKILKPVKVGYKKSGTSPELSLIAGDTIYTLHYLGEGYDLFWYRGQTYSDQIAVPEDSIGHAPYSDIVMAESRPKYEWWVKVKDSHGQMGWTDEATSFAHMDACE